MKRLAIPLLSVLLAFSHAAPAEQSSQRASEAHIEAGKLLDVMKADASMQAMMNAMLDAEMQQKPELVPYRKVMTDFFAKYMSYAVLRDDLVAIYASEFTAEELRAAREFYATPAGSKFLEVTPRLIQMSADLGVRRVQENLPELKAMVAAEQARLAQLEAEAQALEDIAGEAPADAGQD
ncbi:DUF2059 domain-containing protein [Arenimonas daejeonensis]|uniref:DUF2059 domain-containing protein n=1 Tax=Arenimonas daejeonensis TaxID=370777 RepID=UPI0011BE098A|nr:DUF2059 domain-containing protein [Arenimonas daejeonensis]